MTLRGGRDFPSDSLSPSVTWLSPCVLGKGLRLRLHRNNHRGRSSWQLVDPQTQANPFRNQEAETCTQSRMNPLSTNSEMQNLGSQFMAGAQDIVPARKRGRPPTRKLEFHYPDSLSSLKVPKKRGRKPGFKLKPRMVMSPMVNSAPSSTPEPETGSIPHDAAIIPHSAAPQALTAETTVPDDFTCDPLADSKRYAVDPSDSAFKVMTSQYQTKRPYGYRPSPGVRRQASSPASFQDGNRNMYSTMPDSGEARRLTDKDPSSWGVEEVVSFIKEADPQALAPHADTFRKHEIDGDALLLLKSEMMMKYLGLKLGPALKLCYHIDKLKQSR